MQETQSILLKPKPKIVWTQELYNHYISDDNNQTQPPKLIEVLFWYNLSPTRGLRLLPRGYEVVINAGYTLFHHKLDSNKFPLTNKLLVMMDKHLLTPWYWNNKTDIVLMDEKLSVLMELSGGDLELALQSTF